MQELIKGEVAGKSRYTGKSFAFGRWIFPGGDSILEKGSKELLWVSHVVPLPCVMHKGEVSPTLVIVDVRKEHGISDAVKQVEVWESFRHHPRAPPAAAVNGNPRCHASFHMTATNMMYSFFCPASEQS